MEMMNIKNLSYAYPKGRAVFEDFHLTLLQGQVTMLTGRNGSGKTTLVKLMMGILKPQQGEIFLFNQSIKGLSLGEIGMRVGYVFQYPEKQLFASKVLDELSFPLLLRGGDKEVVYARAEEMIKTFELEKIREVHPFLLSYGEKRRLAIAAVLMNDPEYVILDEPTSSLDEERVDLLSEVIEKLKDAGKGMLIISHHEAFVNKHGERSIQLEGGKVIRDVLL